MEVEFHSYLMEDNITNTDIKIQTWDFSGTRQVSQKGQLLMIDKIFNHETETLLCSLFAKTELYLIGSCQNEMNDLS